MQIAVGLAIRGGVPVLGLSVAYCPTIESATRLQQEMCAGDKLLLWRGRAVLLPPTGSQHLL